MSTTVEKPDLREIVAPRLGRVGHLVAGSIVRSGQVFDVIAPWDGQLLAPCPEASQALLDQAMEAARQAIPGWSADEPRRRRSLLALADRLQAAAEPLGRVVSAETGKPAAIGAGEVLGAAAHARWYAEQPLAVDTVVDDASQRVQLVREPVGVVAAIVPWNAPVIMLINKIAAAILAGDTVVAKPSPFTPFSALAVGELISDLVPPGVVNILAGGDELGATMTRHPQTDMIAFTGSVSAGKAIMAAGAASLKRTLLELGGNDAAIVLPDSDVAAIAPKLFRGAFGLSGQICAAIKRLYVHESLHDQLVDRLASLARSAVLGAPLEDGVTMGPVTTKPQFDRVNDLIQDAVGHGGVTVSGGAPLSREGYFIPPTVMTGISRGVRLVDEEQFGPALPVIPFSDLDDAVRDANTTYFGLGGSIWTKNLDLGLAVARRLRSGGAWVNRHPHVGADVPFGGMKQSGVGREGGAVGIDAFCELKTISVTFEQ